MFERFPETWAPLPTTLKDCKAEVAYVQKELFIWNSRQSMPRLEKNITLQDFNDLDFGISILLEGRSTLIQMRKNWLNVTFKNVKEKGPNKITLPMVL